jgi:EmrB/QacA subfamily drug resistance transporter
MLAPETLSKHRWWTLAVVSLTQVLIVLDGTIVNVALPTAQAELGFSDAERQWVVTAYALAFGSFLLLGGRVADYWGRKRTFLLAMAVFTAGSTWGGLTSSSAELLAARGLQGLAAAFLAPSALAIVTLTFPDGPERIKAFAIFGSLAGAGSAIGVLLGGVLTEFFTWRWCLLVNVPIAAIGMVSGILLLTESRADGDRTYDIGGAITCTLGFGALVYGLTLAERSWASPLTIGLTSAGLVLLLGFVLIEGRVTHPLLPLRILQDPIRATAFAVEAILGATGASVMLYLAFHLQQVLKLPPLLAGLATLPFTASLMAMVPFSIRMHRRYGPRRQLILGPLVSALGLLLLAQVTQSGSYLTHVLPGVVLMGAGIGLTVVPLQNLCLLGVRTRDAGVASAAANATYQLGGSIGLALLTAVYVSVAGPRVAAGSSAAVTGYSAVFLGASALYALASLIAFILVKPGSTPEPLSATQTMATALD